jgi:hypothetical protein
MNEDGLPKKKCVPSDRRFSIYNFAWGFSMAQHKIKKKPEKIEKKRQKWLIFV